MQYNNTSHRRKATNGPEPISVEQPITGEQISSDQLGQAASFTEISETETSLPATIVRTPEQLPTENSFQLLHTQWIDQLEKIKKEQYLSSYILEETYRLANELLYSSDSPYKGKHSKVIAEFFDSLDIHKLHYPTNDKKIMNDFKMQ
jgi:hypothetical protein